MAMERLKRSWRILKRSLSVLKENKRLLLFPLVSLILTLLIAAFFLMPMGYVVFKDSGYSWKQSEHWNIVYKRFFFETDTPAMDLKPIDAAKTENIENNNTVHEKKKVSNTSSSHIPIFREWVYLYFVAIYFVSMFLATFFNVAFYDGILKALNGHPVSVRAGLKFAMTRWKAILLWSLVAGIVGCIIKYLEEKLGFVGSWIMRFVGIAWSVASVFVIPVMIRNQKQGESNPLVYLKKSAGILKKTWGEGLVGYVGFSILSGSLLSSVILVVFSISAMLMFCAAYLGMTWVVAWLVLGGICAASSACLFLWIAFGYLCLVLEKIYIGALYIYGSEGVIPEAFDKETLDMAWKVGKAK